MTWRATVLTLFPAMFPGPLGHSLAGRALEAGVWSLETLDIRDFAGRRDRRVDDTPFGGGAGMVLRADVLDAAIAAAADPDWSSSERANSKHSSLVRADLEQNSPATANPDRVSFLKSDSEQNSFAQDERPLLYVTPRGQPLAQCDVRALASGPGVVVLCGRYEGIDQRVIDARALREISVGDYVLSGGELAAMVVLDACVRLLPGVMGAAESAEEESFSAGLLEYPHYTRPAEWQGRAVPEVLLSGDHARIAAWRHNEAETITRMRRPDLWAAYRVR